MSINHASGPLRAKLSAAFLGAVAVTTLVNLVWPHRALLWLSSLEALVFIVLEFRRIPKSIMRLAAVLCPLSLVALPFNASPLANLERGLAISGVMVSLVSSVFLLARAGLSSPHLRAVAEHLLASHPKHRYVWFSLAAQWFGGVLGMAGMTLLLQVAARDESPVPEDRVSVISAVLRSFSAATLWSPITSNLTILLVLYPTLHWSTVAPLTVMLAAGAVLVGIALNHMRLRQRVMSFERPTLAGRLRDVLPTTLSVMAAFLLLVLLVSHALHLAVVGVVVLLAPGATLALHAANSRTSHRWKDALRQFKTDMEQLPSLAGEVVLFVFAGFSGTVIAGAIPSSVTMTIGNALSHSAVLACLALMLGVVALGFLAVHPVLSAVLLATALPPATVNLTPISHIASILIGWAVYGCATPFSMMSLMASRYSNMPLYTISVRANYRYALVCMTIGALILGCVVS